METYNQHDRKFSDKEILRIRHLYALGVSQGVLGRVYEATQPCISQIVNGERYQDLPTFEREVDQSGAILSNNWRLTEEDREDMRRWDEEGMAQADIARNKGVTPRHVSDILSRNDHDEEDVREAGTHP